MTDHVKDQLCARIEELEAEKIELNEQLDALEQERDALAAHVEFCHKVLSMIENGPDYLIAKQYRALRLARERKPENSLSRIKAQWQAEAVSEFALHHLGGHEQEVAEIYASKLHRQAEGEGQ